MTYESLTLIEPAAELEDDFRAYAAEYDALGNPRFKDDATHFDAYLRRVREQKQGTGLRSDIVPWTTLWLVGDGKRLLGISHLRHRLTKRLRKEGGHIGYNIRPSERRKGYGTKILELTLEKARERGLKRVLVTCDTDNIGSGKIIRKNGGVFEGESISDRSGKPVSRYWINLA